MNALRHPAQVLAFAEPAPEPLRAGEPRPIVFRTRGRTHGPITRLFSPGDLGRVLKPFVFLDLFRLDASEAAPAFGMHPHSGIATLTYLINGEIAYEDSTGQQGVLPAGGVEWMRAGNGVWHTGAALGHANALGFQLWIALPAESENAPAQSQYIAPSQIDLKGPARVLLGQFGAADSVIEPPSNMTYLAVTLKAGERWRYSPPSGHTVAWLALSTGQLAAPEPIHAGELVVFDASEQAIDVDAIHDTTFVLGSAVSHPHDLITGTYSVHTSAQALAQGEAEIRRIGRELRRDVDVN